MPTYALLGATGATGSSVLRCLLQTASENKNDSFSINILVRSRPKLLAMFSGLDQRRSPTIRIFQGESTNPERLDAVLHNASVLFMCVGQNGSPMGTSLVQDSATAVVDALRRRRRQQPLSSCTVIQLRSASLNPALAAQVPRFVHRLVSFCLFAGYSDLRRACEVLHEASLAGLLQYVLVDPPTLHDADGSKPTGHRLIIGESQVTALSYADLGVALCEIADRAYEFQGQAVGVTATGPVKQTWGVLLGYLAQGGMAHMQYRYGKENLIVVGICLGLILGVLGCVTIP
ncbi:hypothetical protein ASPVEDRAFT_26322 [Aspergillus versicolor CBS 583.65]|uniref:NAD(P)-binding domain-containing protein n=1 Tax=Aspergillus versicolor CBS 583.65 TaxID=1036611 RepID=A0A1L9PDI5_ASPVE|nr:uncharacterized protein ASPVEDRAFT_26322 [Aspergillus versicolor CBS 583.65]OJI99514.1 hypothetical protein ASPVEDRAFT_26322 [Aspergillus versicolor CBS 583.65]